MVAPRSGGLSIATGNTVRRGPRSGYVIDHRYGFSTMWRSRSINRWALRGPDLCQPCLLSIGHRYLVYPDPFSVAHSDTTRQLINKGEWQFAY